jgi:hypothetical protein
MVLLEHGHHRLDIHIRGNRGKTGLGEVPYIERLCLMQALLLEGRRASNPRCRPRMGPASSLSSMVHSRPTLRTSAVSVGTDAARVAAIIDV